MLITIGIPTIRNESKKLELIKSITDTRYELQLIQTNIIQSAAKNRNMIIDMAESDIIVQLDDDIQGFFPEWLNILITPLILDNNIAIISARLINAKGEFMPQMGAEDYTGNSLQSAIHRPTGKQFVCSACIAFRKSDRIRFDEDYKSAVAEDTQFCLDYIKKYPNKYIMINNECRLIHLNEMKRLDKKDVRYNLDLFEKKNGIKLC